MIFFDVTAFLLATYRTGKSITKGRKSRVKIKGSANDIIFAQGILYMAPVFVLSITSLVMNYNIHVYFTRLLNAFKLPLSGLLTTRFLLKLRKWEKKKNRNNEPRCSLALQFNTTGPPVDYGNASHPGPPQSVSQSFVSILEELGGDTIIDHMFGIHQTFGFPAIFPIFVSIMMGNGGETEHLVYTELVVNDSIGPRDSLEDLGADNLHQDVEGAYDSPIELDELTRPISNQIKGKRKGEPGEDDQRVQSLSAKRKSFVDLESGLAFTGPSQGGDHQLS
ncbi:hypothetical protein BKA70DRAFT_728411 [Coprinopsis sp. MPI-PUGE-AT-0042]|nr:hypothetical protein BKA70DRAFT_728411 [Coprinopsis sp. MPI-PUGE-AT-0042]